MNDVDELQKSEEILAHGPVLCWKGRELRSSKLRVVSTPEKLIQGLLPSHDEIDSITLWRASAATVQRDTTVTDLE